MGGFGSGRRFGKDCTDDMRAVDMRKLQRQRLLTHGNSMTWTGSVNCDTCATINLLVGADRVNLNYRTRERGGDWRPMNYLVRLAWTACNYGGRRAWRLCPTAGCGRRVAVLYGGAVFARRHCRRLAYRCQCETNDDRGARRVGTIRRRLGWEPCILNSSGLKPKSIHWRTFERLQAEHDAHVAQAMPGMAARLGLLRKLGDDLADRLGGIPGL